MDISEFDHSLVWVSELKAVKCFWVQGATYLIAEIEGVVVVVVAAER